MNSRYELIQILSEHDGLQVCKAADQVTLGTCVIKRISKIEADPVLIHQFRMETRLLSTLSCSGIPKLLDLQESDADIWLAEEYLDGITLESWLQSHPSASAKRHVFLELVDLIDRVHQAGFLYMDLKADNVMLAEEKVYLIDFNAVVFCKTRVPLLYNKDSLPPEAARMPLDERADQIGLGRLHQRMFGPSLISWTCLQADPSRRYSSLANLKRAVRPMKHRRILWSAALVTAVSLMGLSFQLEGRPSDINSAIRLEQILTAQNNPENELYTLMMEEQIDPDLYLDPAADLIMMQAAIEAESTVLCQILLEQIPQSILNDHLFEMVRMRQICGSPLLHQEVLEALQKLESLHDPKNELLLLSASFLDQQIILKDQEITIYQSLLDKIEPDLLGEEQLVLLFEYLLCLQNAGVHLSPDEEMMQAALSLDECRQQAALLERNL